MRVKLFLKKYWLIFLVLVYILVPLDLIPDALPLLGLGDDALLALFALVAKYLDYKKERDAKDKEDGFKDAVEGEIVEE